MAEVARLRHGGVRQCRGPRAALRPQRRLRRLRRRDARTGAGAQRPRHARSRAAVAGDVERDSPAPFFLWIHLFEPHAPYRTGSYAGEVTEVDREVARFVAALRERALWDSIVLSVTSDHGESLGEHGEDTHGYFVYDSTIRVPWILKAPGLKPGPLCAAGAAARRDADDDGARQRRRRGHAPARRGRGCGPLARHLDRASILASTRTARRCCRSISSTGPSSKPFARRRSNTSTRRSRSCIGGATIPAKPGTWSRASAPRPGRLQAIVARVSANPFVAPERAQVDTVQAEKFMALGYIGQARSSGGQRPRRATRSEAEARDLSAGDVSPDALGIGPSRRRARRARAARRNWSRT